MLLQRYSVDVVKMYSQLILSRRISLTMKVGLWDKNAVSSVIPNKLKLL